MAEANGATHAADSAKARIEHQFEALKTGLRDIVNRLDPAPEGYLGRAKAQIVKHPIAAVGVAFGIGYLVMRIARRR